MELKVGEKAASHLTPLHAPVSEYYVRRTGNLWDIYFREGFETFFALFHPKFIERLYRQKMSTENFKFSLVIP